MAHDHNAVAHVDQLRQLGGDQNDGQPLLGQVVDGAIDLRFGLDVDAPGRFIQNQDSPGGQQPAAEHNLLLIASGERGDRLLKRGVFGFKQPIHILAGELQFKLAVIPSMPEELVDDLDGGIHAQRLVGKYAFLLAVFPATSP